LSELDPDTTQVYALYVNFNRGLES
jgi:hypothetical protein